MERFVLEPVPDNYDPSHIQRQLEAIQTMLYALADGELLELHVEPTKPRNGRVVIADGTDWNPGSGRGVYWYDGVSSSWTFLG